MTEDERIAKAKAVLEGWISKQGHDRCWYYPDVFNELCGVLGLSVPSVPVLPCRSDFEEGCRRYQDEQYRRIVGDPCKGVSIGPTSDESQSTTRI